MRDWSSYYKNVGDEPNTLVRKALQSYVGGKRDAALDLGAGNLRDARFLRSMHFDRVVAVDKSPEMGTFASPGIELVTQGIEHYRPEPNAFNLVLSCNTLFFLSKKKVEGVLRRAHEALLPDGILVFNLLGCQDEWVVQNRKGISWFMSSQVGNLLDIGFVGLKIDQSTPEGTAGGKPKRWHLWNCIFRKAIH